MNADPLPTALPLADKYNSFLGKSDNADCTTCDDTADPRFTSLPGADYCTVPYVNVNCGDGERGVRLGRGAQMGC